MTTKQAHQYKIRQAKAKEKPNPVVGEYLMKLKKDLKKAVVKRIDKKIAEGIILEYEWLGTMAKTSHHYGILFEEACGGVICLGNNCTANHNVPKEFGLSSKEVWTLARGACVHWAPKGSASKLIAQGLKLFRQDVPECRVVIAYSDTDAGEIGTVYQATNWHYIGRGKHTTVNFHHERFGAFDERKIHELKKKWKCSRKEAKARLLKNGWVVKEKADKHKYICILGSKKVKKEILSRVKVLSYPKRNGGMI